MRQEMYVRSTYSHSAHADLHLWNIKDKYISVTSLDNYNDLTDI